ncbi:MAG: bifunctional adenosylcobinamide kinase/adenosylcobinamide-phosphate guanylyltransferase, partial [Alphaproteobacteria bacterium]|nr:bifunctional adenosylcobinamide kinase/adenosylcobinamide-phosphate guanylyltransferase [Alphaproteobacteria bacterium]
MARPHARAFHRPHPAGEAVRRIVLVLGGARSGKSRFAEGMAAGAAHRAYIATAEALDDEMRARIALHRQRRGEAWQDVEAPLALAEAVQHCTSDFVLVDCITIWLSNLMHVDRDVAREVEHLCGVLAARSGSVVLVSNEVGLGIVPD